MDKESWAMRMFDRGCGYEDVAVKLDIPLSLARLWMFSYLGVPREKMKANQ
ncbi:hypothetical protein [Lentilitoribacter sp. Alg239-R112]|uniref:hypothetical protein n=1 Tax=Lentilitoribacter sp. Alg239-R112 TaxID=2305987 RepID=UPI0013A6C127|nr:hypothetical protein [Lentilitoribacter sp. Alg239-R112]